MTATMRCRRCGQDVPPGKFCGRCGAHLTPDAGRGTDRLRIGDYAAAPDEWVLQPSIVSSLFPHLARPSRAVFRVAVVAIALVVVLLCALHLYVAMVATTTFAPPALMLLYLAETGVIKDQPRRVWVLATLLGIAIGIGWAWGTRAIVAESFSLGLGTEPPTAVLLRDAVVIPFGGLLCSQLPTLLIRLTRPPGRESLYGFVIGALSATMFAVGADLYRFIPALARGVDDGHQPVGDLLIEAGVRGLTMPVTIAAIGGLVGAALWYARPHGQSRRGLALAVLLGLPAAAALYASVGLIDAFRLPPGLQFVVHVLLALVAVVALRIGLQLAMLNEPREAQHPDLPLLCTDCGHVVPDMTFCPACGVASHAESRMSLVARRRDRPQPSTEGAALFPGYALPAPSYAVAPQRRTSLPHVALTLGAILAVPVAAVMSVAQVSARPAARYACPPECGRPPTGAPVEDSPRYVAADGSFSVAYPSPGSAYHLTFEEDGVSAVYTAGDGGTMELFGLPANGRSAQQVIDDLLNEKQPDATVAYVLPNATVGYQLGHGEVLDVYPQSGQYDRVRIVVLSAVKNDVALVGAAVGPYHQFGPDYGPGPPSAANLELAEDLGKYVNSFLWQGDAPR